MDEASDTIKRIVVGVDFTPAGDNALREALHLTRQLVDSELHITYVIPAERGMHDAQRLSDMSKELRTKVGDLRAHVTRVCAPARDAEPFSLETVFHVRIGEPAAALHQVAVDCDGDLIVVGTNARKGVEKLILGSVAEELIRTARVPVLVAHPKDFDGLKRSDHASIDPPRPGEDIHRTAVSDRVHLEFVPRSSHISGLL